jgi:hypothetical protein
MYARESTRALFLLHACRLLLQLSPLEWEKRL